MRACIVVLASWLFTSVAAAQVAPAPACVPTSTRENASGLGNPHGVRLPDAATTDPEENAEPEPWRGPRVDLGYVLYTIPDGWNGGLVHAASIAGYAPTGRLRLGGYLDGGVRSYSLGSSDAVVRVTAFGGYQDLGRISWFLPYIVATATGGVDVGKRFSTTVTEFFGGLGAEVGAEVNPVRSLHFGVAFGGQWFMMDKLHYGTWQFRVFVGL